MSRVSSLYRLQEIDLNLQSSQTRIEEIESLLKQDAEIRNAQAVLDEHQAEMTEARTANSSADHAVTMQREKITQTEKTLYSGTVTNPKELQDLQMESESLRRHLETLEDRYLEAMVRLEQVEQAHLEASERLDVLQQRRDRQHNELTKEKEMLIDKIARLDEERQAALADVSAEDRALYDDLRVRLAGKALALLKDGVCSACGVELARSKQQEVASGIELVRCSQCSRILYAG
jgi:predicted  nucleic acid-binding Zn-ribbon protein